jgi:CBS-domain-containing membrane protein
MTNLHNLKRYWKNYIWQSACATAAILVVLVVLSLQRAVVISSIGATTFIVFMKPRNVFASSRSVIGGHLVGVLVGGAFAVIPRSTPWVATVISALAVGSTLLLMAVTDTEHPPAAGTALSVVTAGGTWWVAVLAVLTSAVLLSVFHRLLRPYLRDL